MSDKGFGDHASKSVMKNPLLSTAVIGVSLEDLTHNAVLLPAVPSQEVITRQDEQTGSQTRTLGQTEQNALDLSSGDSNSNFAIHQQFSNLNLNPPVAKSYGDNNNFAEFHNAAVSKANVSSEDDFDVNEYFARLQGTRYVSAPLNSTMKDDRENMNTEEENLEEINLNEPDKTVTEEYQHSLTSDIAQNFSQLPNVLPQVASAVFSSFSNMLSMKSREQTPDVPRSVPDYQPQTKPDDVGVTLMTAPHVIKEVAPPPKELPTMGAASNYRITTRKKMYAQIPGLTSCDMSQNMTMYSPIASKETPQYFIPETSAATETGHDLTTPNIESFTHVIEPSLIGVRKAIDPPDTTINNINANNFMSQYPKPVEEYPQLLMNQAVAAEKDKEVRNEPQFETVKPAPINEVIFNPQAYSAISSSVSNAPAIPPPPIFTNLPKLEGQSNIRTVLPPSIARRVSANNPIKHQAPPPINPVHNIFVPSFDIPVQEQDIPHPAKQFVSESELKVTSDVNLVKDLTSFSNTDNVTSLPDDVTVGLPKTSGLSKTVSKGNSRAVIIKDVFKETPLEIPRIICKPSDLSVKQLSQMNLDPPITKLTDELFEVAPSELSLSKLLLDKTTILVPVQPPPRSNKEKTLAKYKETDENQNTTINQILSDPFQSESIKNVALPPKISNSHNFRMTNKKPQYYSGPIEGFGSISNNVKPIVNPVQTNSFQGALYTPQPPAQLLDNSGTSLSGIGQYISPFDIRQSTEDTTSFPKLDINQSQTQSDYNTVFDLSRQTIENLHPPPQESKGFGIIGSLKSKLSSIDINKIQNSVTTFFDPAYNNTKIDEASAQANVGYESMPTYKFPEQDNQLEIYVPNAKPELQSYFGFNYPMVGGTNLNTVPESGSNLSYSGHYSYNYFAQPNINPYSSSINSNETLNVKPVQTINPAPWSTGFTDDSNNEEDIMKVVEKSITNLISEKEFPEPNTTDSCDTPGNNNLTDNNVNREPYQIQTSESILVDDSFYSKSQAFSHTFPKQDLFVKPPLSKTEENLTNKEALPELPSASCGLLKNINLIDTDPLMPTRTSCPLKNIEIKESNLHVAAATVQEGFINDLTSHFANKVHLDNSSFKYFVPPATDLPCSLLFNEPAEEDVANKTKMLSFEDIKSQDKNRTFDQNAAAFFDRPVSTETNMLLNEILDEKENDNDLNICETCREVNKTEEKEVENLTDQLIENITAPIQLSNPVEIPLSDIDIPGLNSLTIEPDPCAGILHIAEATIDPVQPQAATELFGNIENNTNVIKNYGWSTDDIPLTTPGELVEHDYNTQLGAAAAEFFHNKSLIFDTIPTNASDEIKAEYKSSFDETTTTTLPRQMSIPSAPPAEDDSKSDESGLDVQSIEQDAKKDFPIFEEYVIEPSETDDDKIEFKEREKSSEESGHESDTFTSRVERYQKMEETQTNQNDEVFETDKSSIPFELPTSTSPSITIASYFDTGNYAVENYYRNSLTSPSNQYAFHSMPQMSFMTIPPGFENEFKRKLSLLPNENLFEPGNDGRPEYIPGALPQNNLPINLVMSQHSSVSNFPIEAQNESADLLTKETYGGALNDSVDKSSSDTAQDGVKLPDFASAFGIKSTEIQEDDKNISSTLFSNNERQSELSHETKIKPPISNTDPISVFSSDVTPVATDSSEVYNFSRLSSYFSAPTQTDPSKSFFELSQSENHYRQGTNNQNVTMDISSASTIAHNQQGKLCDRLNIPHDTYVTNMNLIRDLTSTANIDTIPKEQVVRSVNFFTIIYDDDSLNPHNTQTNKRAHLNFKDIRHIAETDDSSDEARKTCNECKDLGNIECKHRCGMASGTDSDTDNKNLDNLGFHNIKIRKLMNKDSTEVNKQIDVMEAKKDSGRPFTVNLENYADDEDKEENVTLVTENRSATDYSPVKYHWFYRVDTEGKSFWKGFSNVDSAALENAFVSPELNDGTLVATDGGRFDVNVVGRLRMPVYWTDKPTNVMRCSWFYKGNTDARYVPYAEEVAEKLEDEYKHGIVTGEWHRRLFLPNGEMVVMHGPSVMVHFLQSNTPDAFSSSPQSSARPLVVRRGWAESEIEDSEPLQVDHLLLLCHGVGSACDMRFRPVEEVVDDFRSTSLQLLQSHYRNSYESGVVGRVEVLPISWHSTLHSGERGVDKRLAQVTLDSIPRLRNFTNDTVLDVLFYTSPIYCQTIIDTVCKELNRIYGLFKARNPSFSGGVSLGGHSLGSVILYDLLCHQTPVDHSCSEKRYVIGTAGTGQPVVKYPRLEFRPDALYALGSPIAIFECIRGVELLGPGFCLPTCSKFFNIFHPYDPIAYRIEPLINPALRDVKPFQIPHHKGRKRMHLELKDTMARVGADIKQKIIESIKSTWSSMWRAQPPPSDRQLEKVVEEEMEKEQLDEDCKEEVQENVVVAETLGKLNAGRRVDYVLQEAPFEMINEYLFAMSSHVGYWESEDTMLLVLREVYDSRGVRPDGCVPQNSMTVHRTRMDDGCVTGADLPSTSRGGI